MTSSNSDAQRQAAAPTHLRNGGVSVVFTPDVFGVPAVAHWGAALDDADIPGLLATATPAVMNSSLDIPRSFSIAAGRAHGWSGTPAIEAHAADAVIDGFSLVEAAHDGAEVRFVLRDAAATVEATFHYVLDAAGLLRATIALANTTTDRRVDITAARSLLPLPARAAEIVDFTGRWTHERQPQLRREVGRASCRERV